MWLLPLALLTIGLYQVLSNWALRRRALGRVARTRFNQGLGQAVVQVGIGFVRQDPLGLILGAIVGRAGGLATLGTWLWRADRALLMKVTARSARSTARLYRRFPMISTTSGLLNSLGLQAPALVVGAYYGAVTVGWFALSQRVVALPMTYLGTAVAQVYFAEAAHRHRDEHGGLKRLYFRSAGTLALIGLVPTLVVAVGGPDLFSAVFGSEWAEAGTYARILSIMFFCQFVVVPISQTLNVFEKLELQAVYDLVRLVLGVGTLLLASAAGWSATAAILAYSIGMTASYLLNFALNAHAVVSMSKRATD
jgi:O-antigen/teichoic acid export membrane protein